MSSSLILKTVDKSAGQRMCRGAHSRNSMAFTRLALRSLALQPGNSLISLALTLLVGFSMSIALHAATQAIRLRRSGTPLTKMRVTLWITTAIHLYPVSRVILFRGSDQV